MQEVERRTWKAVVSVEEVGERGRHVEKILDHIEVGEEVDAIGELHDEGEQVYLVATSKSGTFASVEAMGLESKKYQQASSATKKQVAATWVRQPERMRNKFQK